MATTDPRIDAYIAKAAPFAQPVLAHLRAAIHTACPAVEETIKWGMPFFVVGGRPLAHMAAFKAHCGFGFWQGRNSGAVPEASDEGMGQFGRLTQVADLPSAARLKALIKASVKRVTSAAEAPAAPRPRHAPLPLPDDFAAALRAQPPAQAGYDGLAPGQRREYIEWITEAKRAETREKRLLQSLEWLAEGKTRHWKYANCGD